MDISISQQVSATYARNHFNEVTEKVLKEGICLIVRKSKPVSVYLSFNEYQKMQQKNQTLEQLKKRNFSKEISKLNLTEGRFSKYVGAWKNPYPKLSSVEIAKKWTDYVD